MSEFTKQRQENALDDWAYLEQRVAECEEQGADPDFYRGYINEALGELALGEMGDVTGPGSYDPKYGAYHGCDRRGERYPYKPTT